MKKILLLLIMSVLLFNCKVDNTPEPIDVDVPEIEMVEVPAGEFEMGDNFGEGQPSDWNNTEGGGIAGNENIPVVGVCWYGENYYSTSPLNNPNGPDFGVRKNFRGGSRHTQTYYLRSASRENGTNPTTRSSSMGFRIVKLTN
mgnify:CR=1 FL=1